MRFDEARNKLMSEIEHLFFTGYSEVTIVHGIGNYVLRKMAISELAKLDYVRIDENEYNPNPGSLKVQLLAPEKSVLDTYRA